MKKLINALRRKWAKARDVWTNEGLVSFYFHFVRMLQRGWLKLWQRLLHDTPALFRPEHLVVTKPGVIELRTQSFRIAVQAHMFYPELAGEFLEELAHIPCAYDLYIITDTDEKAELLRSTFTDSQVNKVVVQVYPNRGRDVRPMLLQLAPVIKEYDLMLHLHTKKSKTDAFGDGWRRYLLRHLLGNSENVENILTLFASDERLGIVFPETYPLVEGGRQWGGERVGCKRLLRRLGYRQEKLGEAVFPAGSMFWARTDAVLPLFEKDFSEQFPQEKGQVGRTLAHDVERIWARLAEARGYGYRIVYNGCMPVPSGQNEVRRIAFFVHYDKDNRISDSDAAYVRALLEVAQEVVFITNNPELPQSELDKVRDARVRVMCRENVGFDFGAWRDGMQTFGFDKLGMSDELILANNSCYAPMWSLQYTFQQMASNDADFWGMVEHPEVSGWEIEWLHSDYLPWHLQSYFLVFRRDCFMSPAFQSFWMKLPDYSNIVDAIAKAEIMLTPLLTAARFCSATVSTAYIDIYHFPYQGALLGVPLAKKKAAKAASADQLAACRALYRGLAHQRTYGGIANVL